MVYQLKVRKKGIVILPKDVRVKLSINENDILIANIEGDKLVLRPLKPKIVRVDPKVVEDILKEEGEAERKKEEGIFDGS
ncbi:AbrB family transcriptional regulator [Acidianus hospitalis]|jgi:AbrB family looped-hinge helix DNA binding protein|uniref:AbrB family transcriptional regulator n=1 Tax=Acidianus hospitalis TaxID=563177 RepID=A0A2T9X622_9CREN|nr:AbrB family transcriptional regulator [Acidianus hospitalis]